MRSRRITVRETGLTLWPYEIAVTFDKLVTFQPRNEINRWLESNHIQYQYMNHYTWHLVRHEDVTLCMLRWA